MDEQIEQVVVNDNQDYIDTINELKKNTVSKTDYEKLKADNKRLLDSVLNGEQKEVVVETPKTPIEDLKHQTFFSENTNLQYVKGVLEIRDRLMAEGKPDPFLPNNSIRPITQTDIDDANLVASVLKECIDYAGDDSLLFTNELQRRLI